MKLKPNQRKKIIMEIILGKNVYDQKAYLISEGVIESYEKMTDAQLLAIYFGVK